MHHYIRAIRNLNRNTLSSSYHPRAFSVKELPWCSPKSSITKKDQWATQLNGIKSACDFHVGVIAAMDENRVIGIDGQLPWAIPEDRRHFISFTRNKTIIIGRRTYFENEDLSHISHVKNVIVVSKTMNNDDLRSFTHTEISMTPSQFISKSLDEAISIAKELHTSDSSNSNICCWIAGGQKLYEGALRHRLVRELQLTIVHAKMDYDPKKHVVSFFPPSYRYDNEFVEKKHLERIIKSENDEICMSFRVFSTR